MHCHACGREFELAAGERVGFRDECEACGADLHACRGCAHHDPSAYNECHEPNAERVSDRERANRCDYFSPASGAASAGATTAPRASLDALFKKGSSS